MLPLLLSRRLDCGKIDTTQGMLALLTLWLDKAQRW